MNIHSGAVCWICLEGGPDEKGKPIVRDCACRGNDAGFVHTSCIIKYAEQKCLQAVDAEGFLAPWGKCPNCDQSYQNELLIQLSDAFVSYAKRKYEYPGNHLPDKIKVMEALRHQIQSNRSGMLGKETRSAVIAARRTIQNLIHKLLKMVDQTKKELNMDGWVHMAPSTYQYQCYRLIRSNFEAYGYYCLGQLCPLVDTSEEDTEIEIGYYKKARDVYKAVGDKSQTKLMTDVIDRARAKYEGDDVRQLENTKRIYENRVDDFGENSEPAIMTGLSYAFSLRSANFSIKAERFLTKLVATSRQLYGEEHKCTTETRELLDNVKRRLVRLIFEPDDKTFQALRYENDGEICVVMGPVEDEEERPFSVESTMIHPEIGCPVIVTDWLMHLTSMESSET